MSENESQFLETVGLLALAAVIALVSALITNGRWQKASGFKHNYRWGLFLGRDAMLIAGLLVYHGIARNPLWLILAAVYGPIGFLASERRKWAFITLTVLTFNPIAWGVAFPYVRKRKEGFWSSKDSVQNFFILAMRGTPTQVLHALQGGADVNGRNKDGLTPLECAAGFNTDPEVVRVLVRAGADVLVRSNEGETALGRRNSTPTRRWLLF